MARYSVFVITSLALLLSSISGNSIAVAFPIITKDFDVSLIFAGWVLTVNLLISTACQPLGGKAGEIFGVKRAYIFSLAVFTLGSLICALAPNMVVLILGRFFQAIGFGTIQPLGTAIVGKVFSESRQQAIGFLGTIVPFGSIVGPIIGGWLVESFGWRSTFWFNIPLGLILFFASLKILKGEKGEIGQMDLIGTGYFTGALSAFLIAINTLGNVRSSGSWLIPGVLFVVSIALFAAFLRREGRIKNPIIELDFLRRRPFFENNIYHLIFGGAAMGVMSLVPLFATSVYGMSTLESGLILTPRAVGTVLAMMVTSYYLPRWGYRWPLFFGTCIVIISLILLGLEPSGLDVLGIHFSPTFLVGLFLFLTGVGTGIVLPVTNNICIDLMPERIGMITGLKGLFRQSGGTISITATTLVLDYFPDMGNGFMVVFLGLAFVLLVTSPTIFMMPKSPNDQRWTKQVPLAS